MEHSLEITLTARLPLGDLAAEITLSDGSTRGIILREGHYAGTTPAPVTRLRLIGASRSAGEAPLRVPGAGEVPPARQPLPERAIEELFETGVGVEGGRFSADLSWGLHCHRAGGPRAAPDAQESEGADKFGTFEHIQCAARIGRDAEGGRLAFGRHTAAFSYETYFSVGGKPLTFGQIIALAGDYYAHLDPQAAAEFSWAWPEPTDAIQHLAGDYRQPTLEEDELEVVRDILFAAHRDGAASASKVLELFRLVTDAFGAYPVARYLALASQNFCHFACQGADGVVRDESNEALRLYRAYHQRALRTARASGPDQLEGALIADAFGCHFLTDLFATGHLRVPRRELGEQYGVMRGAQGMAHAMHCEDNTLGLWCTTRHRFTTRWLWRGYGDSMLLEKEAKVHREMVEEAVRRSVAEVFAAACGVDLSPEDCAEAILPVPLPPGQGPVPGDKPPGNRFRGLPAAPPNHFPLYASVPGRGIAFRVGGPGENRYLFDGKGEEQTLSFGP